jgi:hypothetical protein
VREKVCKSGNKKHFGINVQRWENNIKMDSNEIVLILCGMDVL